MQLGAAVLTLLVWEAAPLGEPSRALAAPDAAVATAAVQNEPSPTDSGTVIEQPVQAGAAAFATAPAEAPGEPELATAPTKAPSEAGLATAAEEAPADEPATAEGRESGEGPVLQLALEGTGGSRGEGLVQLVALCRDGALGFGLGVEGALGPLAPLRQGLIAQGEVALGKSALHGEVRVRPEQAGASRSAAELSLRREGAAGSLELGLRGVSALVSGGALHDARATFAAAAAALDAELALGESTALGVHGSGALNELRWSGRPAKSPWDALGTAALEWPDRWEAQASLRFPVRGSSATALASVAGPAAPGTLAVRGGLRVEAEAGFATLALAFAVAHQLPARLWLAELALAATFRFGGAR